MFWFDKEYDYFSIWRSHFEAIAKDQTRWNKYFSYVG